MRTQMGHHMSRVHPQVDTEYLKQLLASCIYAHRSGQLTRRCFGEKYEQPNTQEYRNHRARNLSHELVLWFRTQQVAGLEIASHIACLSGRSSGDDTRNEVDLLRWLYARTCAFGHSTEDELGGFGYSGHRVDIRVTRRLDTDEGEDETED